jgi:hypothetical protein
MAQNMPNKGDIALYRSYVEVVKTGVHPLSSGGFAGIEYAKVRDIKTGKEYDINGAVLLERLENANRVDEDKTLTKTAFLEEFKASKGSPIQVHFLKSDGTDRTMNCVYVKQEGDFGKSYVIDLDNSTPDKDAIKQITNENIRWYVVGNTKYIRKDTIPKKTRKKAAVTS